MRDVLGFIGGIGTTEIVVVLLVALVIFGKRLPEVAKQLGEAISAFRRSFSEDIDEEEMSEGENSKL